MPSPEDAMRYQMEDAAIAVYLYPGNDLSLASMAISLKRIADALTHDPDSKALNIRDLLSGIEMNGRGK